MLWLLNKGVTLLVSDVFAVLCHSVATTVGKHKMLREMVPMPLAASDPEEEVDPTTPSETSKKPKSWQLWWESQVKGSPALGAFNIICCVVGVGLLGLPYAMSQSGWIGVPLLVVTCAMATYTCVIMGAAMQATPGATSFGDLGQAAYGPMGKWMVAVQQYMTMIGVAAIFLVVLASGLKQVAPETFPSCNSNITTVGLFVCFHIFFHKLNEVAILSAFNLVVAVLITVVVSYQSVLARPATSNTVLFNTQYDGSYNYQFLIAFPTIAFAFGCHTIIPAVYEELKDKNTYSKMCYVSMPITLLMYLPVAVIGYWAFGDKVQDPIFKNFDSAAVNVVVVLLLAHVVMSYAIIMNPPELAFEDQVVDCIKVRSSSALQKALVGNRWPLRLVLRLCLTGLTVFIAKAVPCFPVLLSLVSSVTGTTTSFIFPVLFYLRLVKEMPSSHRTICRVILLFATIGGVTGTYNAILGMKECHLSNTGC